MGLPGWWWMTGMRWRVTRDAPLESLEGRVRGSRGRSEAPYPGAWPDVDDPATAGCLLVLLGPGAAVLAPTTPPWPGGPMRYTGPGIHQALPLGRACVAVAESLGRWPRGES